MDENDHVKERAIRIFIASLKSHGQDIYMEIPKKRLLEYKEEIDRASGEFSKSQFESLNHIYRKDHILHFYAQDRETGISEKEAIDILKNILDEITTLIVHTCAYLMSIETKNSEE